MYQQDAQLIKLSNAGFLQDYHSGMCWVVLTALPQVTQCQGARNHSNLLLGLQQCSSLDDRYCQKAFLTTTITYRSY